MDITMKESMMKNQVSVCTLMNNGFYWKKCNWITIWNCSYIEADGGYLQFVEIEEETNFVKVRLGGACTSCAMSAQTLKMGIEKKLFQDFPDCNGVIQVLWIS